DLPYGSRGGIAVRHYFPLDGESVFKIRLQTSSAQADGRGTDETNLVDVRVDGVRIQQYRVEPLKNYVSNLVADAKQNLSESWNLRVPVKTGMRVVSVALDRKTWYVEGVGPSQSPVASFGYSNAYRTSVGIGKVEMGVDELTIEGPFGCEVPQEAASRR